MTQVYTQEQIDSLRKQMVDGVASATGPDGQSVTKRSLNEMERMLRKMESANSGNTRPKRTVAAFDGGFGS